MFSIGCQSFCMLCIHRFLSLFHIFEYCFIIAMIKPWEASATDVQYFDSDRQRLSRIVYRVVAQSKFVIPYCYHSFLFRAFHFPIAGAGAIEKAKLSSTATNEKWMRKKRRKEIYRERKKNERTKQRNKSIPFLFECNEFFVDWNKLNCIAFFLPFSFWVGKSSWCSISFDAKRCFWSFFQLFFYFIMRQRQLDHGFGGNSPNSLVPSNIFINFIFR